MFLMRIIFYRSLAGREPVREYLSGLPLRDRAAAADVLDAIREHGLQAPGRSPIQADPR